MDTDVRTRQRAISRLHVHVRGVVQDVGFRPFVHKLAHTLGLSGHIFNSTSGVTIEVEGSKLAVELITSSSRADLRIRRRAPWLGNHLTAELRVSIRRSEYFWANAA